MHDTWGGSFRAQLIGLNIKTASSGLFFPPSRVAFPLLLKQFFFFLPYLLQAMFPVIDLDLERVLKNKSKTNKRFADL